MAIRRANTGPLFYRLVFRVVAKDDMSVQLDPEPVDTIMPEVKSAEAAIREARCLVELMTKRATRRRPSHPGFRGTAGAVATRPATIVVDSVQRVSRDDWDAHTEREQERINEDANKQYRQNVRSGAHKTRQSFRVVPSGQ